MSKTISVGVFGASYWAYMATVMYESLGDLLKIKKVKKEAIPIGIYKNALQFFNLALEAANDKIPINPLASINAYIIATDAIPSSTQDSNTSRKQLKEQLQRYKLFLDGLPKLDKLSREDKTTAKELEIFFYNLANEGGLELYEKKIHFDPPDLSKIRFKDRNEKKMA